MTRHIRDRFILVVLCSFLVACGGGGGSGGGAISAQTQAQNVLNSIVKASVKSDNAAVLSYFTPEAQDQYKDILSDSTNLTLFGESFSKAKFVEETERCVVYKSTYNENERDYSYFIFIVKDNNGNWKMDTF